MSGATVLEVEGVGVCLGEGGSRAESLPEPARRGRAARRHGEQVGTERVDLGLDLVLGALAEADGEHDRGDPDHDPEHGQAGAKPVGPYRREAGPQGLEPTHQAASPTGADKPSCIRMVRSAAAATSASWVMTTRVRPAWWSSSKRVMTSLGRRRVERPGRFVSQDQRRIADQGPGHGHALLLTSGQLAGTVIDPVGRFRPGPRRRWPGGAVRRARRRRR